MEFKNIGDLVNQVNIALGDFCNEFGRMRKEIAGLGKVPTRGVLFKYIDTSRDWAINEGGGTEIQYHIGFNKDDLEIIYGLGFNTQTVQFKYEMSSVEYMQPFMNGYIKHESQIKQILPDYNFVYGSIEQLKNPKHNEYTLFGKRLSVEEKTNVYFIEDSIFKDIIDDLKKQFQPYQIIFNEKKNFKKVVMDIQNNISIIKQKGQVILQGPPGTGKTREAKIIGRELVLPVSITVDEIQKTLKIADKLKSATDYTEYEISKIDLNKVTLKLKTGSEYSPSYKEIIKAYEDKLWEGGQSKGNDPYSAAIAKYIFENLDCSQYLKIIQFHPAYSYEDFVRGIVAESKGDAIEYKTKNKILASFAKIANTNYINSKKVSTIYSKEKWIEEQFEAFVEHIEGNLESEDKIELTPNVSIFDTETDAFRYKGKEGWTKNGNRMLYSDIKKAYFNENTNRQEIKKNTNLSGLAHHHASYYIRVLDLFKDFLKENKLIFTESQEQKESLKTFVLIIDEINRANLPAVLGELIYALEYRGEKVESLYETEEDGNALIIPPNLYIIGTMNTSDRSVGHIDYAIRRRFAFIDVLPNVLEGDNFELELFKQVSALFIQNFDEYLKDNTVELKLSEYLSEEFRPKDVWLGHSYFIRGERDFALRKKYEIIPILKEYVKDGILKQSAESIINSL